MNNMYDYARSSVSLENECANGVLQSLHGKTITLHEPYQLLWRQYHALETYSTDQSNPKDHRAHITVLLDFLRHCDMPNVPELIALCNPDIIVRSISYASLWLLYTPGTYMMEQRSSQKDSSVFFVDEVKPPSRKIDPKGRLVYGTFRLICLTINYDGKVLSYAKFGKTVETFEGDVSLSELEFIPLSLLENHENKRQSLISRGQKFWDLRGQHMKEFVDGSYANRSLVVGALFYTSRFNSHYINIPEINL